MEKESKYGVAVLALTAGFVLFCAGWFGARLSIREPWQVNTAQRPVSVSISEETENYPDSLLPGETINVNTADIYDLQRLPGIGEKRAQDIIEWRESHGPFQTVEELTEISGIGPGILDGIKDYVTTGSE